MRIPLSNFLQIRKLILAGGANVKEAVANMMRVAWGKSACDKEAPVPRDRAVQVRNILMLRIFLTNFRRAGDLANFTLGELNSVKKVKGDMVCTIRHHETQKRATDTI